MADTEKQHELYINALTRMREQPTVASQSATLLLEQTPQIGLDQLVTAVGQKYHEFLSKFEGSSMDLEYTDPTSPLEYDVSFFYNGTKSRMIRYAVRPANFPDIPTQLKLPQNPDITDFYEAVMFPKHHELMTVTIEESYNPGKILEAKVHSWGEQLASVVPYIGHQRIVSRPTKGQTMQTIRVPHTGEDPALFAKKVYDAMFFSDPNMAAHYNTLTEQNRIAAFEETPLLEAA